MEKELESTLTLFKRLSQKCPTMLLLKAQCLKHYHILSCKEAEECSSDQ